MSEVLAGITGPFSVGLSERPAWAFSHGRGVPSGSKQQRAGPISPALELAQHCSHPWCLEKQVRVPLNSRDKEIRSVSLKAELQRFLWPPQFCHSLLKSVSLSVCSCLFVLSVYSSSEVFFLVLAGK